MDTGCPLMVAFGVAVIVGVTLEVGLTVGVGLLAREAANSTSSALSLPCTRVPATRTRSPRRTPWVADQADWRVRVVPAVIVIVMGCVIGCVTVAVELATVIVMT